MVIFIYNKDPHILLRFIFYFIIIFPATTDYSQNEPTKYKGFTIEFEKSISGKRDFYEKNILDLASDLIFGNDVEDFVKPVNIVVKDTSEFLILDQGIKNIININIKNGSFEKAINNREFPSLIGLCWIDDATIMFSDSKNNKVYVYKMHDDILETFVQSEKLNKPTGIAFNQYKKEVWIVQTGTHSISVFDINGELIKNIGKRGNKELEFNFPTSIWIDKNEKVYVVDAMNFRIQILNSDGDFLSMFGEQGDASGYFARPKGIAADTYGNIYVVDALFHNVQIFDKDGNFLNYFGHQGKTENEFWLPQGIFIDQNDRIYVADSYNSRIQIFQLSVK